MNFLQPLGSSWLARGRVRSGHVKLFCLVTSYVKGLLLRSTGSIYLVLCIMYWYGNPTAGRIPNYWYNVGTARGGEML